MLNVAPSSAAFAMNVWISFLCFICCHTGVLCWLCSVRDCSRDVFQTKRLQQCPLDDEDTYDQFTKRWQHFRLPRIDPVRVGYTRHVDIIPGHVLTMRTLSTRPPIFEIEDFMSVDECEAIISMAQDKGMENSRTSWEDSTTEADREDHLSVRIRNKDTTFTEVDMNRDEQLDQDEIKRAVIFLKNMMLDDEVISNLIQSTGFDEDGNGFISREEFMKHFNQKSFALLMSYLDGLVGVAPKYKTRFSETAFLEPSDFNDQQLFDSLEERIHKVTQLPYEILRISENLQVVRYQEKGHYHCHMDSEEADEEEEAPCCHYQYKDSTDCLTCRYMTLFYILREPEDGGETAFILADNATFNESNMMEEHKQKCDLSLHCQKANLLYKPKRGTAIMWYNHLVDPQTGWLGPADPMSTHGGCDVIKGVKWAANTWLNIGYKKEEDLRLWKEFFGHTIS